MTPENAATRFQPPLLKLGRRDDAWPDLAKPSLDADLFLSVVPMSAHMGVRRGQGAAGELNKHVGEQPSSSKLVSLSESCTACRKHHPRSDQSGHVEQPACRTRCPKEPHAQRSWHLQRSLPAQSEDLRTEVWLAESLRGRAARPTPRSHWLLEADTR